MRREHLREYLIYVMLGLVTLAIYWPITRAAFINYDDNMYILENAHVQSGLNWKGVTWAFTTGYAANWHPLTWISHEFDCQLYGLDAGKHHLTSLLFHIANTLLLFGLLRVMTGTFWRSAMVAALFAWHPMHVESVAWVAERKDVLSTFFWLLTMLAYWKYANEFKVRPSVAGDAMEGGRPKSKVKLYYALALICFALGLMCKPMLVTLPFVLLLMDFWPLGRICDLRFTNDEPADLKSATPIKASSALRPLPESRKSQIEYRKLIWEKVPFFILAGASCVITFLVQRSGGALRPLHHLSADAHIANALFSYVRYLGKIFWPIRLAVFYPYNELFPGWQILGAALGLLGMTVWTIRVARRRPYLIVGWLWFLGTLVPVIGLIQVGIASMANRYTYIPALGIFIATVWYIVELSTAWTFRKGALGLLALTILASCIVGTCAQIRYWQDSEALWRHTLAVTADNAVAEYSLGQALSVKGKIPEAMPHFVKALRLDPNDSKSHNDFGLCLAREGKFAEATNHYVQALSLDPTNAATHYNYGLALAALGKPEAAAAQYWESIRLEPNDAKVRCDLGLILIRKGEFEKAKAQLLEAIKLKPDYTEAHVKLGLVLSLLGESSGAAKQYQQALDLNPDAVEALNNLAWIRAASSHPDMRNGAESVRLAQRACELTDYRTPMLIGTLAAAYAEAGRFQEAVETGTKAGNLARSSGLKELAQRNEELVKLYRAGQPFHGTTAAKN